MRALLYVRLSREDLKGKAEGIDSTRVQTMDGKAVIADLGWTLHSVQVDDDVSGTLIDRPGLATVRAAARNHEIDVVVFRCLDRLTRLEAARTMALLLELLDLGVRVYDYEKRRFISLSGTEGLLTYVEAMKAEGEATKASERVRSALRARAREGRVVRMACFGYRITEAPGVGKRYMIDPAQAAIILRIGELFASLGSLNAVASRLNQEGIKSSTGSCWRAVGVRKILIRPLYRGLYEHGVWIVEGHRGAKVRKLAPEENIIRVEHPELRIWPAELEAQIDALLARPTKPWGQTPRHLSTPFVKCGVCGGSVVATGNKKGKNISLVCDRQRYRGCVGIGYRAEPHVDRAVLAAVSAPLSGEVWSRVREILAEALEAQKTADRRGADVERLRRDVQQVERRIRAAEELVLDSEGDERETHRVSLRAGLRRLEGARAALQRAQATTPSASTSAILDAADERVRALRETLAQGGVQAVPAVRAVLGDERFEASRNEAGGWQLRTRISTAHLYVESFPKAKQAITGLDPTGAPLVPPPVVTVVPLQLPSPGQAQAAEPATPAVKPATEPAPAASKA